MKSTSPLTAQRAPRRHALALATTALLALATAPTGALAQDKISDGIVKIGMLTDLSGVYADIVGPGAVIAANMAIADFGGKVLGRPIELIVADTRTRPTSLPPKRASGLTPKRSTCWPTWPPPPPRWPP